MSDQTRALKQLTIADVFPQFITPVGFPRTKRDAQMIRALYIYRFLTAKQFEQMFWYPEKIGVLAQDTDVNTRCLDRLRKMTETECAFRASIHLQTRGKLPYVYFLWLKGELFLIDNDGIEQIDWNRWRKDISEYSLWHSIQVNDVRIAMELSARRNGFTIEKWVDEPTLKHTHAQQVAIDGISYTYTSQGLIETEKFQKLSEQQQRRMRKMGMICPDGYFVITAHGPKLFQFIEVDRRTETGMYKNPNDSDWAAKVDRYKRFFVTHTYQKLYDAPTTSCRVLTITTGEKRLANMKKITEDKGGKNVYWFTTRERALTTDITTAPIWQKAGSTGLYSLT
jgi:hypothetical protein